MLDFFREHKFVSGSISVMLALLLLPLYALISSVVESARYRSAQEQLSELTFLGEMAILADYVDFLASDYSLYAYEAEDADILKESFEKYMKKAESAGGVDTTKLNKLFGVDIEKCDIRYMYSIADPEVLTYQIRTNGRFSLPIKTLNEVVLSDVLSKLGSALEGVNKKLSVVKSCSEAIEDATGVISDFKTMQEALQDLKDQLNVVDGNANNCVNKRVGVDWNILYDDDFSEVYEMWKNNAGSDLKDYDEETSEIVSLLNAMNDMQASFQGYFASMDEEKAPIEVSDESGRKLLSGVVFDNDNKANGKNILDEIVKKIRTYDNSIITIDDIDDYKNAIEKIDKVIEKRNNNKELYNKCSNMIAYAAAYSSYYESVSKLKRVYCDSEDSYLDSLSGVAENFSNMVASCDSAYAMAETIKMDGLIEDLNKQGEEARKDRAKYEKNTKESADAELRENMKKSAEERRRSYNKAREELNFVTVGSSLMEKFVSETIQKDYIDKWRDKFNTKIFSMPTISDYRDAKNYPLAPSQFVSEMNALKDYNVNNYSERLIEEYDFCKANGGNSFYSDYFSGQIKDFIVNDYDKVESGEKDEFSDNEYITYDDLKNIYGIFIDPPYNSDITDINKPWFNYDEGKSYYLSQSTLVMFFGFLIGSAFVDGNSETSQLLDTFKQVFKAMQGLKPNDIYLNNHIGGNIVLPSNGAYYNNSVMYPENIIDNKVPFNYAYGVMGNTGKFPLDSYYISGQNGGSESFYNYLFGGRQPGVGVMTITESVADVIDNAVSFVEDIMTLNIIKGLKELLGFIKNVIRLITGIISFVIDIIQVVTAIINDPAECLQYVIDQLYIGSFAADSFTSRQTAKGYDGEFCDYNTSFTNHCGEDCYGDKFIFDGAEMEYILGGSECEITNQHRAYYAIMLIRFILNFAIVAKEPAVQGISSIPFAGPVLLVLVVFAESSIDMMFLVGGVKVPLIKNAMSLNPSNWDNLSSSFQQVIDNIRQPKMKWRMGTTENGDKYRIYENPKTQGELFNDEMKKTFGMDKESSAKGILPLEYDWYINVLLLFYPENVKLGRICDLMQMHGIEDCDDDFRLENCYTYVYADVRAEYSPLLPMITEGGIFPDIRNVQLNGY